MKQTTTLEGQLIQFERGEFWTFKRTLYAAGFVDAEGCILWHGGAEVAVMTCYPRTLRNLAATFGGQVFGPYRRKGPRRHKAMWRWVLRHADAFSFLNVILPHLEEKRAQALLLVQMYNADTADLPALDGALRALKRISHAS